MNPPRSVSGTKQASILALLLAAAAACGDVPGAAAAAAVWPTPPARALAPPTEDELSAARARALREFLRYVEESREARLERAAAGRAADASSAAETEGGRWEELPPPTRSQHAWALDAARRRLLVFGGVDNVGRYGNAHGDVWALSLASDFGWQPLRCAGTPPGPRAYTSAIYDPPRDRMLVFGGADDPSVWALSLAGTPTWTALAVAGESPGSRWGETALYDPVRDRMLIVGGHDGSTWTKDVWALSLAGVPTWTDLGSQGAPAEPLGIGPAVYDPVRDRILALTSVGGGVSGGPLAFSLEGPPQWTPVELSDLSPSVHADFRARLAYDPLGDRLVLCGNMGFDRFSVWALSLADVPAWSTLDIPEPHPPGRVQHTLCLDPQAQRMIVYGGQDDFGIFYADAWALSLDAAPTWSPLSPPGNPPVQREGHSAILDPLRERMVVFGGGPFGAWGETDSGRETWALSLPGGERWQQLLPAGAPPAERQGHTAIYDPPRGRMLVFGGRGTTDYNDTWALSLGDDPVWTPLVPQGEPPPDRYGHVAAYDAARDRMLVFGGASDLLGTEYDDLWALSLDGVPAWQQLFPAGTPPPPGLTYSGVYDDASDRLLVYRGDDASVWELAFTPALAWTRLQPSGTPPSPRSGHSAILDVMHRRLVVFGGEVYSNPPYLGDNDAWTLALGEDLAWERLSPQGTPPTPRRGHSAVYDLPRDRMVVFGGNNGPEYWTNSVYALGWTTEPTPVLASLVESHAEAGRVRLSWLVTAAPSAAHTVYRRTPETDWAAAGMPLADGRGQVAFEDIQVEPGMRYAYRLGVRTAGRESFSAEVWVEVPSSPMLAVTAIRPNPASREATVSFALPVGAAVRLELMDVGGRRVLARELDGLGAGAHAVRLGEVAALPPGLYLVRLTQGARSLGVKLAVVR